MMLVVYGLGLVLCCSLILAAAVQIHHWRRKQKGKER